MSGAAEQAVRREPFPAWSLTSARRRRDRVREPPARAGRRASGRIGGATGAASRCASSTAASSAAIRWSAGSAARSSISLGADGEPIAETGRRGRPLRPRHRVRRGHPRHRARRRALLGARARRRVQGLRRGPARRPALGDRAGLRRDQHEPLDDQAAARRHPARAGRHRVLPPHDARRLGPQHAGRVVPVAVLVGDLGREPRGGRPARSTTPTPTRRSSSSREASTSRSPGSAADDPRTGQQLRDAVHLGDRGADPRQASRPHAVRAEDGAASDLGERRGGNA